MSYKCEFCENMFTSKSYLNHHQKTAKYCLIIQGDQEKAVFICKYCDKHLSSKKRLKTHYEICNSYSIDGIKKKYEEKILEKDKIIDELKQTVKDLQENLVNLMSKETEKVCELQDKLQEIAKLAIDQKNEVISSMVKKYVKKQPRKKFDCSNVVYILTTPSLKKERRYILGKAKNLTNRLSTYNKTEEHEVVYYQECDDEESMNTLEPLVFKKLGEYREQANRERFILPDNTNIELFIDTIKECISFVTK